MENKIKKIMVFIGASLASYNLWSQIPKSFEVSENWHSRITELAPSSPRVKNTKKKRILVFSKATGYEHWSIPHNNVMLKILGKKSGAFEVHIGYDIQNFQKNNLKKYDGIILNNTCPANPDRNLFADLLHQNSTLSKERIAQLAREYEQNLMMYVSKGGGLMLLHGGITVQNNSLEFSKMTGGSFDYHPKQQKMHVKEVDSTHPMVQAFKKDGFIHVDEPYFFKNAYNDYNFRPLLYIETNKLEGLQKEPKNSSNYISWIKKHGKGRVFYSAPGHNAQSLENPELLQFYLDGMQYIVGDLKCDDSPLKISENGQ
ncbi:ThuA domain-containing protein [Maribacter sp. 2304DJ31-5]|uniref:ThuA domain-containing protein n=1 Tax=Maribacter sp. 2304DJ31-5 TaxID=3386273 RepID=UPI0039BD6994